jgi:thiamine kinase
MANADVLRYCLERWQDWQLAKPLTGPPELGALLARGSGHSVYNILSTPQLIGRVRQQSTRLTDEAFSQELTVWSLAAQSGLAPRIVYADEKEQAVICERADTAAQPASGEALGSLCRRIHALPGVSHQLALASDIEHYLKQLPAQLADPWRAAMETGDAETALAKLAADTLYLCHNDLTPGNLMTHSDHLIAIDWEYAAMGSRYFDVAIACEALPDSERVIMMNEVFGDALDDELVMAGKQIAALVTALWQCCFAIDEAPSPAEWLGSSQS